MRVLNRVLALLLTLAIGFVGVVLAVEAILLVAGKPSWLVNRGLWNDQLRRSGWSDTTVQVIAALFVLAGVALLAAELWPRRAIRFEAQGGPDRTVWVARRGVQRRLRWAAGERDDVDSASARVGRRRAKITATLSPNVMDRGAAAAAIATTARASIDGLRLARPLAVKISARPARGTES